MDPEISVFDVAEKSREEINIESGILEEDCIEQIKRARESETNR